MMKMFGGTTVLAPTSMRVETNTLVNSRMTNSTETISSEFDREVDNHYYSMKEKFEKISELLKE